MHYILTKLLVKLINECNKLKIYVGLLKTTNKTVKSAGVRKDVSDETVRRVLRGAGYQFLHSRKKDLLKNNDLKKRRKFARKVTKMLTDKFWEEGIWFYIDAAGFQNKCKPHDEKRPIQAMAWRLENEGLHPHCTVKGSHVGSGGRVVYFIAAISHQKSFSRWRIPKGKRFLQDGCPVQNSKKTRQALDTVGAIKFSIPPRSQDFNPIKSIFNFIKRELRTQAFEKNLNYETFEQFSARVKHTIENTLTKDIDTTTVLMPKRMLMFIKSKGQRTKY